MEGPKIREFKVGQIKRNKSLVMSKSKTQKVKMLKKRLATPPPRKENADDINTTHLDILDTI